MVLPQYEKDILSEYAWISRLGPTDSWQEVAQMLSTIDFKNFIKGMAIAEHNVKAWYGGSAASILFCYKYYPHHNDNDSEVLGAWLCLVSKDCSRYLPFHMRMLKNK